MYLFHESELNLNKKYQLLSQSASRDHGSYTRQYEFEYNEKISNLLQMLYLKRLSDTYKEECALIRICFGSPGGEHKWFFSLYLILPVGIGIFTINIAGWFIVIVWHGGWTKLVGLSLIMIWSKSWGRAAAVMWRMGLCKNREGFQLLVLLTATSVVTEHDPPHWLGGYGVPTRAHTLTTSW